MGLLRLRVLRIMTLFFVGGGERAEGASGFGLTLGFGAEDSRGDCRVRGSLSEGP